MLEKFELVDICIVYEFAFVIVPHAKTCNAELLVVLFAGLKSVGATGATINDPMERFHLVLHGLVPAALDAATRQ